MLQEAQIKSLVVYAVSSLQSQYITRGISHINIHHYVHFIHLNTNYIHNTFKSIVNSSLFQVSVLQ